METKFIELLTDILEIEDREIKLQDIFREYEEWDSLANLSVIALIDEEYGVVFDSASFKKLITVGDILEAVKSRMA